MSNTSLLIYILLYILTFESFMDQSLVQHNIEYFMSYSLFSKKCLLYCCIAVLLNIELD